MPRRRRLVANPWARITALTVDAPHRLRGRGYRTLFDPQAIVFLLGTRGYRGAEAAKDERILRSLEDVGILVAPENAPQPVVFPCALEAARELAPGQGPLRNAVPADGEPLAVSPLTRVGTGRRFPEGLRVPEEVVVAAVNSDAKVLWTMDPRTGIYAPFALNKRLAGTVERLVNGRFPVSRLPPALLDMLRRAQALVAPGEHDRFRLPIHSWSQELVQRRYAVLRDLIHPMLLGTLRRHCRALDREGYLRAGDEQSPLRKVIHNDHVSRFVHFQLAPLLSRITGEKLKASYAYLAVYQPGATLPRHTDREQCAWNLSLVLDTDPERPRHRAWPIYLEAGGRPRRVQLGMGDGLLYRGTELPHWRNAQPKEQRTTVCFFHFVDRRFKGDLN